MKRKLPFTIITLCLMPYFTFAQKPAGIFDNTGDVGPVRYAGSTTYDPGSQAYQLSGSGANIWFTKDEFHYAYKEVNGDFILQARGKLLGEGVDPHRKFGWMVRTAMDTSAAMVRVASCSRCHRSASGS